MRSQRGFCLLLEQANGEGSRMGTAGVVREKARSVQRKRWIKGLGTVLALVVVSLLLGGWWSASFTRRGQATYSVIEHRIESQWSQDARLPTPLKVGRISGAVRDERGRPLAQVTVVASDRYGRWISAVTDREGRYLLEQVPAERVVPAAVRQGYQDQVYRRVPWSAASAVRVRPNKTTTGIDFTMVPVAVPAMPTGITRGQPVSVSDDYPKEVQATRTQIAFQREGYVVSGYVYEPLSDAKVGSRLPGIVAAYPGDALNWEPASIAFVAQGYVVLGMSPTSMRDLDVRADAGDLSAAMRLFCAGALSEQVDRERIGALGGSFSSMALVRALQQPQCVRGAVLMGGVTDAYSLRYDAYYGGYTGYAVNTRMEWTMWSLGRPDRLPRMYVENSAVLHTAGLPPLCLIHGTGDAVVPYDQSERLAGALARSGQPYELHIYQETGHYPGIHEPDPDTEAMYQVMVHFFADKLAPRPTLPSGIMWTQ
jgi:pimeloyl-ACP methyl ester carboxylesterase